MSSIAHLECSHCHTHIDVQTPQTVCPQCGGVHLVKYDETGREMDHRGVVLPARHRAGGIITPQ